MSKVIRDAIRSKILSMLQDLNTDEKKSCSLLINGDKNDDVAVLSLKGNTVILAEVICARLEQNERFKDIFLSIVGSYLANNHAEKQKFMEMINIEPINLN